jgi:predicted SnoaL-like aldol condensation-catalyzing enzyme
MFRSFIKFAALASLCIALPSFAQVPVTAAKDHKSLLASSDPKLAANKKLVYDFWREVFEAGHMELAPKYMTESYIQHNPNVASGRDAFVAFFSKFKKPQAIANKINMPLVSITAEGDLVTLTFVSELKDPDDATKTYTTTWFDMFRIENGKIAEHWDNSPKL